jgi:hypothetical protein
VISVSAVIKGLGNEVHRASEYDSKRGKRSI